MSDLPRGWVQPQLEDLVDVLDSRRIPVNRAERAKRPGDVPYYGATGQVGWIDEPIFNEELVLLGEDGAPFLDPTKPKAYVISGPSWVNNHAHVLRARESITTNRFLKYALDHVPYQDHVNGTTRLKLTQKAMRRIPIPLPPPGEQERIVAAIEQRLSRLDSAEAQLSSTRRRLRALQTKLMDEALPHAPEALLGDLAVESRYGTSTKCSYEGAGQPVLRIPNIVDERIELSDMKFAVDPAGVTDNVLVREGDVLFVRTNGSRDLIGRAAAVPALDQTGFASYLIRYRFRPEIDPQYVCAAVSAPRQRRILEDLAATTAGQYNLSISKLDSVKIPLPSIDEQRQVVTERRRSLERVDRLGAEVEESEKRCLSLRRSILSAAFSGRLVPQRTTDEPVSVLLERVRDESPVRSRREVPS